MENSEHENEKYEIEKYKISLEHAWEYFKFHAAQRIVLFRYYIIFFSFFFTGAIFLFLKFPSIRIMHELAGMTLSIGFICVTIVFHLLDTRNIQMIEIAKKGLIELEKDKNLHSPAKTFSTDVADDSKRMGHKTCFLIIFISAYTLAGLYILACAVSIGYFSCFH